MTVDTPTAALTTDLRKQVEVVRAAVLLAHKYTSRGKKCTCRCGAKFTLNAAFQHVERATMDALTENGVDPRLWRQVAHDQQNWK